MHAPHCEITKLTPYIGKDVVITRDGFRTACYVASSHEIIVDGARTAFSAIGITAIDETNMNLR